MNTRISFLILSMVLWFNASTQQFGGFPPSTRWQQINTDTTRIIFAAPVREDAQRIASIIHQEAKKTGNPIGNKLRKVNIVLHHQTTLANGYVALGPFRSEYYLVPGSNLFQFGNLPWYEQLAVHEYRHVQQYSNFRNGLTNVFYVFAGEEGQALANSISVPDWFFEGDAVYAETALTTQGRGRTPYFFNAFKSLWTEGRDYSWAKLRNGSLKDFVPNHYDLGYLLVNYGYQKYGTDFWQKVTRDASSFKGLFYPLQSAIKHYAGVDYKTFRAEALNYYKKSVPQQTTTKRETVTNYYFPLIIGQDSLLYVKNSYKTLPSFYLQDKSGEHRIKQKNISAEDWFSYRNGLIAYTAYSTHPRWSLKNYSDIILLNLNGDERRLTKHEKYFTPDISPSGTKIAAVHINDTLETALHILDAQTGAVLQTMAAPEDVFYFHPRFIDEDNLLIGYRLPNATVSFHRLNLRTGNAEEILAPTAAVLGYPFISNGTIYFSSSVNGNDDIYSLDMISKKLIQLTNGQTGNYYANVSGDSLVWSHFTVNGLRIQKAALPSLNGKETSTAIFSQLKLPFAIASTTVGGNILRTPEKRFGVKRYSQTFNLFNFHSWRPYYEDPEASFTVYSDNVLNTFSNALYYKYNINESSHAIGMNAAYGGLFPVLISGVQYTFDRHLRSIVGGSTTPARIISYRLNELEPYIGFYVPLNFTRGKMYKSLTFGSSFVFNKKNATGTYKDSLRFEKIVYLSHTINWAHQLPKAVQQIYPKFGYAFSLNHKDQLDGRGYQFLGSGNLYLPTVFKTHSIVLSGSFQQVDTSIVLFTNRFANARGYDDYYFSRMWRGSANYHLPLVYPDWGFANIFYLMRICGNAFYDFSRVYSNDKLRSHDFRSVGGELFFETKWWNQLPITVGLRLSHLLDNDITTSKPKGSNVFEIVLPVSIIPR